MKTLLATTLLACAFQVCFATEPSHAPNSGPDAAMPGFEVERLPFGSGTPTGEATMGTESAHPVVDGLYHVPNYMPGFPTASSIWPREVPIECDSESIDAGSHCSGYRVTPAMGRGEYIFVRPYARKVKQVVAAPLPQQPLPVTHKQPLE